MYDILPGKPLFILAIQTISGNPTGPKVFVFHDSQLYYKKNQNNQPSTHIPDESVSYSNFLGESSDCNGCDVIIYSLMPLICTSIGFI